MDEDDEGEVIVPIDPDLPAAGGLRRRRRFQPDVVAAVAAGGALGAPARYEMTRLIHVTKDTFPWATLWTNLSGSLVLGFTLVLIIERFPPSRYLRPFFATGFIGAYTTFSTYMVETDILVKDGRAAIGITYVVSSALAGFTAVWIGIVASRAIGPGDRRRDDRRTAP